jgi:hypothetical protein
MEVLLTKFGWLIGGAVAAIVWLVRLEAIAISNRQEIKRLWGQRGEDLQVAKEAREATNAMLSEIRNDVKDLLRAREK